MLKLNGTVSDTARRLCSLQRIEAQHYNSDSCDEGNFHFCSQCGLSTHGSFSSMSIGYIIFNSIFAVVLTKQMRVFAIAQADIMT